IPAVLEPRIDAGAGFAARLLVARVEVLDEFAAHGRIQCAFVDFDEIVHGTGIGNRDLGIGGSLQEPASAVMPFPRRQHRESIAAEAGSRIRGSALSRVAGFCATVWPFGTPRDRVAWHHPGFAFGRMAMKFLLGG